MDPGEQPQPLNPEPTRLHRSAVARGLFTALGFLSLSLGILGMFVPLLPTTVFILIAAYCFARSSERFYEALLRHKRFGPMIRDWQTHRCISRRNKRIAITLVILSFGLTTGFFLQSTAWRVGLLSFGAALALYLYTLPTCERVP